MGFNWEDEIDTDGTEVTHTSLINADVMNPPPKALAARMAPPQPGVDVHDGQFLEEILAEESEEDFEAVLADANLRIELATLYKMIMNHDLFEGMDSDPRAIETVTRGIRKFAREQMEIMLGMRQEASREAMVSSPFNDLEVLVLKKVASTYSKGATESADAAKPQPVAKAIARREGLNTISAPKVNKPVTVAPPKKALAKAPAPLQRKAPDQMVDAYVAPTKKPEEVTAEDLIQRNKEAAARQNGRKQVKSQTSIPMPSPDQEEMFQTQRVMTSDHPLANPNAVSAIVSALNKSKTQ